MRNTLRNLPEFLPSRTAPTLHRHAKVHGPAGATALLAAAALLATPGAASAHEAHIHQHGLATLELSQQEGSVIVHFRSPLDSLIGFETEPATPEQHAKAHLLLKQLQDARAILSLPAAAGCTHQAPAITAPTLQDDDDDHGHGKGKDHDHEH
ncbi:MAG: DUF2796 domain-containing protein, partial [Lautropia sp.]|nr:DUF2796 domain-containing protein [Lautropia sp.]